MRGRRGRWLAGAAFLLLVIFGGLILRTVLQDNQRASITANTLIALARHAGHVQVVANQHYVGTNSDGLSGPGGQYCFFFANVRFRTSTSRASLIDGVNAQIRQGLAKAGYLVSAAAVQIAPDLIELEGVGIGSGGRFDPRCW